MNIQTVADYYTPGQLALRLGLAEHVLEELVNKKLLLPKVKGEKRFFSSRQAHDLEVALRLTQKKKLSLDQALLHAQEMRHRHTAVITGTIER